MAAWAEACALLADLDALDADGRITKAGESIAAVPLHPRLAHMVTRAAETGEARMAAMLAMLLSEHGLGGRDVDLRHRLRGFDTDRSPRAIAARRMAEGIAARVGGGDQSEWAPERAGALLLNAYPERVAKARGKRGEFLMTNGRAGALDETDALARGPYLAIAEAAGRAERTTILSAAPVGAADVEAAFAHRIENADELTFDVATTGVRARRVRRLGRIVLSEAPLERPDSEKVRMALLDAVRANGLSILPWTDSAQQARARVALMRRLDGDIWPDFSDEALLGTLDDWLSPALDGVARLTALNDGALASALLALLSYARRRTLDEEAPARFRTPADGDHLIDYAAENGPALDVRLQELFGVAEHPAVGGGRAPLLLRLLSPAHRPVQTTRDLPGFWRGSYAAVRAEMKGRYPKHPWPEDPLIAEPTRRAKPRGS